MKEKEIIDALAVLELDPGATQEECRIAWRALSKKWHPDLHEAGSAAHKFAVDKQTEVNAAYDKLRSCNLEGLARPAYIDAARNAQAMPHLTPDQVFDQARAREKGGDVLEAMEQYRHLAEQGHPKAQFRLGYIYFDSVMKDIKQAVYWWKRAAEQGHTSAQFNLGLMYEQGLGVNMNQEKADRWFQEAAKNGDKQAQAKLNKARQAGALQALASGRPVPAEPPPATTGSSAAMKATVDPDKAPATSFVPGGRGAQSAAAGEQAGRAFIKNKQKDADD